MSILATAGCAWSVTSNVPWVNIVSLNSGSAIERINYLVLPNTGISQRTGIITAAGRTFTVTQAGTSPTSCNVTMINTAQTVQGSLTPGDCLSPLRVKDGARPLADRYSFNAGAGQPVIIALTSADFDGYLHLLDPNGSLITQNDDGASGGGSRIPAGKSFYILPTAGKYIVEVTSFSRSGFGNYSLSLQMPPGNCTYAISSAGQTFPVGGGTGLVNIDTQPGCGWETMSNNGWLTITTAGNSGPGAVNFTVAANTGAARTGMLTVAGLTFTVTQAGTNGSGCPTVSGINPTSGAAGDAVTITGTNFTGASGVRFNNNVAAPFTFIGDTQLSATVPAGAVSGPLTIQKPACPDTQTLAVTVNRLVVSVSAASFFGAALAGESIAAAFGSELATGVGVVDSLPLPTAILGTTVRVRDSAGVERLASLFFVAPSQINYQIPEGTLPGSATITVTSGDGKISTGTLNIAAVAPGLFTANASGLGLAAASILRVKSDGAQITEPIAVFDTPGNRFVSVPVDFGPDAGAASDQLFLILYGTGLRFRSTQAAVTCVIGGVNAEVLYAGPQGGFLGLDQINVRLLRSLIGRGEVDVVLFVDGKATNTVRVHFK